MNVTFCGIKVKSPTVLASGILGNSFDILKEVHRNGCGLVTMKSIGPKPRDGHKNPTVLDFGEGLINAVGLPTPGYENMDDEWKRLSKRDFPIIASIYGASTDDFVKVAAYVAKKKPDFIELNISCPNTENEGMIFGIDEKSTFEVVSQVKKVVGKIPLIPKLTPQAYNIGKIAKACESAGADAICAINTVGPGMVIDIESGVPILDYKTGGISGRAIKPIAIRCVYEIYENVKIPIIGMGGISNSDDAIEMFMAGASLIGIGSAIYPEGIGVFGKVDKGVDRWLAAHKKRLPDIIGIAHMKENVKQAAVKVKR